MRKTKVWFLPVFVVLLAMILAGCTKDGDPTQGNVAPDTRILSYVVSSSAELDTAGAPTNNYAVTVYWAGSDKDGSIKNFQYSFDGASFDSVVTASQYDFVYDFTNASSTYDLWVRAVDNNNATDPSPAHITIKRDYAGVETAIADGPPNGAIVGTGVQYKIQATTATGTITNILYRVDDGAWNEVAADELGEATFNVVNLAAGARTISFAGKRDDGKVDATPAAITVIARVGQFAPTIVNKSPVSDGGGWFSGASIPFSWGIVTDYYYGLVGESPYSYAWDDTTNFDNSQNPLASGWVADNSYTVPDSLVTAGTHVLYLKAIDNDGAVSTKSITVEVAAFAPTQGILLIDDFSWLGGVYASDEDIDTQIANGFMNGYPFTERNHDQPPVGPNDLAVYSTVILYGDGGYQNEQNGALFAAYASAGGNLMLTGYSLDAMAPTFSTYGIYPAVFGQFTGNYGGMDGQAGTAYENFHIELPGGLTDRSYERVYDDAPNTQSIFAVRGNDGDTRSCGVRADMPNGNVVIVIGQSIAFWDQNDQDTKDFGNYVLGTEFGETK